MNKELILKLIIANLENQASRIAKSESGETYNWNHVDTDDSKFSCLDGYFNLEEIAEIIMKEFENE